MTRRSFTPADLNPERDGCKVDIDVRIKRKLRAEGLNPRVAPNSRWLRRNGLAAFVDALQEHEEYPDDPERYLIENYEFVSSETPSVHRYANEEEQRLLEEFYGQTEVNPEHFEHILRRLQDLRTQGELPQEYRLLEPMRTGKDGLTELKRLDRNFPYIKASSGLRDHYIAQLEQFYEYVAEADNAYADTKIIVEYRDIYDPEDRKVIASTPPQTPANYARMISRQAKHEFTAWVGVVRRYITAAGRDDVYRLGKVIGACVASALCLSLGLIRTGSFNPSSMTLMAWAGTFVLTGLLLRLQMPAADMSTFGPQS